MARKITIEFLGQDKSLGKTLDDIEGKSGKLTGVLGKVGKVAAVGFGAMVAGAGAVMVSGAKLEQQYSKTMSLVGAATNASADTMRDLDDLAMKMGAETAFSANEAAEAMLELAKAGVKTKDIMGGGLKNTLLLASAGGTSLGTAATIASNAMNTFSLKGTEMKKVAAALAGGANASSASVESLGQGLQQVGPGAVNAGLSLQETVAALSAFDAAGIKGSDAGTSLKTMLSRLVPTTEKASKAMEGLGLDFVKGNGEFESLSNIAGQLQEKMGGLSDAQRTVAMNAIFGSDASRAATVLMKEGTAGVNDFVKATNDQGAAQRMADAAMSGTAGAMERLRGALETVQLQIGKAFAPVLVAVANWLSTTGIPAFSGFTTWLTANVPPAFEKIKAAIQSMQPVFSAIGNFLTGSILPVFQRLGTEGPSIFARLREAIEPVVRTVISIAQNVATKLRPVFEQFIDTVRAKVIPTLGLVIDRFQEWWPTISKVVSKVADLGATILANVLPPLIRFAGYIISNVVPAVLDGIEILAKIIGKVAAVGAAFVNGVADVARFVNGVREKIGNALEFIGGIPGKALTAVGDLGQTLWNAGSSLIQGLIDGIMAKWDDLKAKLKAVTDIIPDWKGPLDKDKILLTPAGEALMEGLIAGIEKKKTKLQTVLEKITDHIKKKQDSLASLLDRRQSIVDSFKGMASSVFGASTGTEDSPASVDKLVAFQANQRSRAEQLNADVGSLLSKGLSKDMIRQLIESGQSGIDQINLMATATDAQIADLVANNAATQAALEAAGLKASEALIGEQIAQAERDLKLADTIRDKLKELLEQQDKNTVVQLILDGKVIHASLMKLKREKRGKLELA